MDDTRPESGTAFSILLVEDNPINQKVASLMLSRLGLAADMANRGDAAIEKVQGKPYDFILMDLHMPGMHGEEAANRIRKILGERCPPIVALTADVHHSARETQGLDGFLTKPISVEGLRQCILEHTGRDFGQDAER